MGRMHANPGFEIPVEVFPVLNVHKILCVYVQ